MCLVLRPGTVFKPKRNLFDEEVDGKVFIAVANLKWGLLVWPMVARADGSLLLDRNQALEWFFTVNVEHFDVAMTSPVLTDTGLSAQVLGWEHPVKGMLRNFSIDLTMAELVMVAKICGVQPARSRQELVRQLASHVGDTEFVNLVMAAEEKKGRKKMTTDDEEDDNDDGFDSDDSLAELLLDEMDLADAEDFISLKKRVNNRQTLNKKRKWAKWIKEDKEVS